MRTALAAAAAAAAAAFAAAAWALFRYRGLWMTISEMGLKKIRGGEAAHRRIVGTTGEGEAPVGGVSAWGPRPDHWGKGDVGGSDRREKMKTTPPPPVRTHFQIRYKSTVAMLQNELQVLLQSL